jgi:hypothetical protein
VTKTEQDIDVNWKTYALARIENLLPIIMQDLNVRADSLVGDIAADKVSGYCQKILFRSEFTIRKRHTIGGKIRFTKDINCSAIDF